MDDEHSYSPRSYRRRAGSIPPPRRQSLFNSTSQQHGTQHAQSPTSVPSASQHRSDFVLEEDPDFQLTRPRGPSPLRKSSLGRPLHRSNTLINDDYVTREGLSARLSVSGIPPVPELP